MRKFSTPEQDNSFNTMLQLPGEVEKCGTSNSRDVTRHEMGTVQSFQQTIDSNDFSLLIAFESKRLSYSDLEVDLHNSGINQILSVAAARGHRLCHFSMSDLYLHEGLPFAMASFLALPDSHYGNPLEYHHLLRIIDKCPVLLSEIDLCFFRADDVRHSGTPNLDILHTLEKSGTLMESIAATLSTNDKYELVVRVPDVPQPITCAAGSLDEAREALDRMPGNTKYFVLKDRYGYGCGQGVHRLEFTDPELTETVNTYLARYNHIILQEFCPEVGEGDLVVTFFDGKLLAPMRREAVPGEWKTNYSLGANQYPHTLTSEQERIARTVQRAFPECRFLSVDMLQSGKVLEVNAFPGGKGLLELYGIAVGNIVMDQLEKELLGMPKPLLREQKLL